MHITRLIPLVFVKTETAAFMPLLAADAMIVNSVVVVTSSLYMLEPLHTIELEIRTMSSYAYISCEFMDIHGRKNVQLSQNRYTN